MDKQEIEEALDEGIRQGLVTITGLDKKGELLYKITPLGVRHVERLLGGNDSELAEIVKQGISDGLKERR